MKRFSCLVVIVAALVPGTLLSQDAATEERLNRLAGQMEDLVTAHKGLQNQIKEIAEQVERLRDQMNKPNASYLTAEDTKPLVEKILEVDRKRVADGEKIQAKLNEIQQMVERAIDKPRTTSRQTPAVKPEKGYEHTVQSGDTISTIVAAYREQNVKVTVEQVLKANPGLKPERMQVGQKIFIPMP